jgi:hypothetical protein
MILEGMPVSVSLRPLRERFLKRGLREHKTDTGMPRFFRSV